MIVTCYLLLTGLEAEALIAPSAAFVEPILGYLSFSSLYFQARSLIIFRKLYWVGSGRGLAPSPVNKQ